VTELLHELVKKHAELTPSAIAIEEKDKSISYQQLAASASQIAELLLGNGSQRGDRVGIIVDKSIDAYLAIYGILAAGCAYVPLDKRAPVERVGFILNDCQIETLLVTSKNIKKVISLAEVCPNLKRVVVLDQESPEAVANLEVFGKSHFEAKSGQFSPDFQIVDSDLAYILYTSGSTGAPKGVMINHHTSMSFVKWSCNYTNLTAEDRVSAHAPLHFDLSVFDIYATAMAGATLVPVPDGASTFPSRLLDWMCNNKITVWYSVPSILSMMAQQKNFESCDLSNLRTLIFAGEVFPVPYLKIWLKRLPGVDFMNWFGPTETNVSTSYTVDMDPDDIDKPLPIGKATDGADLILVNENGEIVTGKGESGEIYARGPCVALGYWGDEEKTKDKFVANPFKPWLDDRVFKSGDIVTIDDNGNFIFQGRNDHLVKVRGYRIELGEVEAAFYQSENIVEAVVVPIPDEMIGNRLHAFVVTKDSEDNESQLEAIEKAEKKLLNQSINKRIPSYMVPDEIHVKSVLPKTSNGKIDRQTLSKQISN